MSILATAAGLIVVVVLVSIVSLMKMSGECSRLEEKRELDEYFKNHKKED